MERVELPLTRAEHVADYIRQDILVRSLKPGDLIGTQDDLADELGVSRNVIRDAVGRLRGLGLIDSLQGTGLFVTQPDPAATFGLVIPQYALDHARFSELVELRWSLEIGSVETVVQHATDADIARLRELGEQLRAAASGDRDLFHKLDAEFHKTILSASKNPLLSSMHRVLALIFWRSPREYHGWRRMPEVPGEHAAIAAAFASRDAERARNLLKEHLLKYSAPPRKDE